MLSVGDRAPAFECTAVVDGDVVGLEWDRLHDGRVLVLVFGSVEDETLAPGDFAALSRALVRIEHVRGRLAIVCRDHVFEIATWANRVAEEGASGDVPIPLIADSDSWISSHYEMVSDDGQALWGHVIVDPAGRVRQIVTHEIPIGTNVTELIRCIASLSDEGREADDPFGC